MLSQRESLQELQEALLAGRLERGIAIASSMEKEPDESVWLQGQMRLALAQLDLDRATDLAKSLALHPDANSAQRSLAAWHLIETRESQWAEAVLRSVLDSNPGDANVLETMALLLIERNRFAEAAQTIDRLSEASANGSLVVKLRKDTLLRQGRTDEALALARQLSGSDDRAAVESAFSTIMRYADSREAYTFLRANRKVLGNVYWILRARYCLKYEPQRVMWCLKKCSKKTAEAHPMFYIIIATVLREAKLWPLMEEPLIEALRLDAHHGGALRLLAETYEALGRTTEAKAILTRYPSCFSETEPGRELRDRLLS